MRFNIQFEASNNTFCLSISKFLDSSMHIPSTICNYEILKSNFLINHTSSLILTSSKMFACSKQYTNHGYYQNIWRTLSVYFFHKKSNRVNYTTKLWFFFITSRQYTDYKSTLRCYMYIIPIVIQNTQLYKPRWTNNLK